MVALSVTLAAGSALVNPVLEAPAVTAACRDTGGFMNTAAVHVTAQGTVTPTLVTAFLAQMWRSSIQPPATWDTAAIIVRLHSLG